MIEPMEPRTLIPYSLVWFRLLLAPAFWVGYALGADHRLYAGLLIAGIVSDIFDGVLARRWKTSTPKLRRFDSNVDSLFYGSSAILAASLFPAYLKPWWTGFLVMFLFLIAQNVVHGLRFREQPAYHMWSGKLWSIAIVVALTCLFLGRPPGWALDAIVVLGIYNCIEAMIASLILPRPMVDIPTVFHAIKIAKARGARAS
jgi:CDP-diacylglycerol---glycerol-3-phosphate 3-phosphatidyltransferase